MEEMGASTFSQTFSRHASDVVELFDDVSQTGHSYDMDLGGSPLSSRQPVPVLAETDDMPVFDDFYLDEMSGPGNILAAGPLAFMKLTEADASSTSQSFNRSMTSQRKVNVSPHSEGAVGPPRLGPRALRHGSNCGVEDNADACTAKAPFWQLEQQMPPSHSCEVLGGLGGDFSCAADKNIDEHGFEMSDRDLIGVEFTSRAQRLELRDFLCEIVANKKAASLYLLYDVEAEPPEYARPPSSAHRSSMSLGTPSRTVECMDDAVSTENAVPIVRPPADSLVPISGSEEVDAFKAATPNFTAVGDPAILPAIAADLMWPAGQQESMPEGSSEALQQFDACKEDTASQETASMPDERMHSGEQHRTCEGSPPTGCSSVLKLPYADHCPRFDSFGRALHFARYEGASSDSSKLEPPRPREMMLGAPVVCQTSASTISVGSSSQHRPDLIIKDL
jgi:hypothetical protein